MIDKIVIEFIDNSLQRYPTVGDYWLEEVDEKRILQIRVSKMNNQAYECMVAIHEFVEWLLTDLRRLPEQDIMNFDLQFEKEREEGKHTNDEEPGFSPDSPYLREHTLSTAIEMMICAFSGISWDEYNKTVMSL